MSSQLAIGGLACEWRLRRLFLSNGLLQLGQLWFALALQGTGVSLMIFLRAVEAKVSRIVDVDGACHIRIVALALDDALEVGLVLVPRAAHAGVLTVLLEHRHRRRRADSRHGNEHAPTSMRRAPLSGASSTSALGTAERLAAFAISRRDSRPRS